MNTSTLEFSNLMTYCIEISRTELGIHIWRSSTQIQSPLLEPECPNQYMDWGSAAILSRTQLEISEIDRKTRNMRSNCESRWVWLTVSKQNCCNMQRRKCLLMEGKWKAKNRKNSRREKGGINVTNYCKCSSIDNLKEQQKDLKTMKDPRNSWSTVTFKEQLKV